MDSTIEDFRAFFIEFKNCHKRKTLRADEILNQCWLYSYCYHCKTLEETDRYLVYKVYKCFVPEVSNFHDKFFTLLKNNDMEIYSYITKFTEDSLKEVVNMCYYLNHQLRFKELSVFGLAWKAIKAYEHILVAIADARF